MIAILRFAQLRTAGGSLGQRGLNGEDVVSFLGGLVGLVAGQREHFHEVLVILFADALEPLALGDVVLAIRKRQSGLAQAGNLLGRVLLVLLHAEAEQRRRRAFLFQCAQQRRQLA